VTLFRQPRRNRYCGLRTCRGLLSGDADEKARPGERHGRGRLGAGDSEITRHQQTLRPRSARASSRARTEAWERKAIIDFHAQNPLEGYRRLTFMIDIAYLNVAGTFYYLCSILDGASRAIVHWDIREAMTEMDVEIVIQRSRERFPDAKPRMISDNGPQFIAKDFKEFIRVAGMTHVRTAPYYPLELAVGLKLTTTVGRNSARNRTGFPGTAARPVASPPRLEHQVGRFLSLFEERLARRA
jgi:transposase InsO family protein